MIRIFTDGACVTERKDGGWAALLLENGQRKVLSGREGKTTSNRMELTAAIKALESTPEGATIILASDSQYLIHTMTKGWRRQANL
ncbi:MAG: ribonuclease HI, partial [Chloroflexi bacterium]|nr:ribonuclease HI [Chloroflexota bacterium]